MQAIAPAVSFSLKTILLATDFSPGSQTALQFARGIAHRHSSDVYTIHVTGVDSYRLLQPEPLAITFNQFDESCDDAPELLKALIDGLPAVPPVHRQGRLWEVVEDVVSRNKIDLLVVATHGRTGLARMVQGSAAEELFRNVSCPTLNVGPEVKGPISKAFKARRILMATDFDLHSTALQYADWLANEFQSHLSVVHVRSSGGKETASATWRPQARLKRAGLYPAPELIAREGAPAAEILKVAGEIGADIIVMGARHPEPARIISHWPWDTAATVIAESKWPVLTLREK